MKIGLYGATMGPLASPAAAVEIAQLAEARGFDSLWTGEHMALPDPSEPPAHRDPTYPFLDPIVAMSFLAAHTTSIQLALGLLILPQRHPVQLAKELATLDIVSGGRLLVGVGVGYLVREYRAVGVEFATRGKRSEEYFEALNSLWRDDVPGFSGRFVQLEKVNAYPRPITVGGPPIYVGGNSDVALNRAIRWNRGWYGFGLTPDIAGSRIEVLRQLAREAGRDPESVPITIGAPLGDVDAEMAQAYRRLGIERLLVRADYPDLEQIRATVLGHSALVGPATEV